MAMVEDKKVEVKKEETNIEALKQLRVALRWVAGELQDFEAEVLEAVRQNLQELKLEQKAGKQADENEHTEDGAFEVEPENEKTAEELTAEETRAGATADEAQSETTGSTESWGD